MNRERLKLVRDRIAAEPAERLDMSAWHCGTAHCIGGWAIVLGAGRLHRSDTESTRKEYLQARDWLGLKDLQADALFIPEAVLDLSNPTQADALSALDSLINAESDDALPVWPSKS